MAAVIDHPGLHDDLPAARRLETNRLGLWLFIASETFLFSAVIAARFYLLGFETDEALNQPLGLLITSILLLSSLTAYLAEAFAATDDQRGFRRFTSATIVLGSVFVVGVAFEWAEAFDHFPPQTLFGTVFFTLTGLHAFHVVTGVIALGTIRWTGRDGRYGPDAHWPVEAVVKYWHFVDVIWVFVYPTLYLLR
jgi:cytochrome c oxidase subunit 3